MTLKTISYFIWVFFFIFVVGELEVSNESTLKHEISACQKENQFNIQSQENNNRSELKGNESKSISLLNNFKTTNFANETINIENGNSLSNNHSAYHISCYLNKSYEGLPVEIVNSSKLAVLLHAEPNITNRQIPGNCIAIFFYSVNCPFSCLAAPHFNALPRLFPDIKMVAIDAIKYRSMNAQFGIVGTPTLMLFHNGRPAAKFNQTAEYHVQTFSKFVTKFTGLLPEGKMLVTTEDLDGPVPSVLVKETNYYLILSWSVIIARILYSFFYSTWGRSLVDATLNAWREAEAQHHHAELWIQLH